MFCHGWQNKAASSHGGLVVAVHVTLRKPDSGRLRFSYFRTTEQNRLGFVQVANQKTGNRLLTPESYYEIIPKTVFVYISYIVQMQMEPDNSECSPLPLKTAIPNRPPLAVQP